MKNIEETDMCMRNSKAKYKECYKDLKKNNVIDNRRDRN